MELTITDVETGDIGGDSGHIVDVSIGYQGIPSDPSIAHHEVGHWVHFNAIGHQGHRMENNILQGSANFLAALHSGDPIMGGSLPSGMAFSINTFVRLPNDLITTADVLNRIISDPMVQKKYPKYYAGIKEILEKAKTDPTYKEFVNSSDPSQNYAIITQPLWLATAKYGLEVIKILYVKTIAMLNEDKDYSNAEIATALINNAEKLNPALSVYLQTEYSLRRVFDNNPPQMKAIKKSQINFVRS